jgi:LPXTG-motif cell wall-anchored protein
MMYSVFVPAEGQYHYYETTEKKAVNADLPVPTFGKDAGKIGVAAMDAARPLPFGAVMVGRGWHARGVLANKGGVSLSLAGMDVLPTNPMALAGLALASAGLAYLLLRKKR